MTVDAVERLRHFHRSVTERVGALESEYLGRGRPLGESRVLWEIGPSGADVRSLRGRLALLRQRHPVAALGSCDAGRDRAHGP